MNKTFQIVTTIFYNNKNQILLIKRANVDFAGAWGLPGGKVEEGEEVDSANKREHKEELGIENLDAKFVKKFEFFSPGHAYVYLYCAELNSEELRYDEREVEKYAFYNQQSISNLKLAPNHREVIDYFFNKIA